MALAAGKLADITMAFVRSSPLKGLAQRAVGTERDRIEDHPALAPLHPVHLRGLALGRHVLVEDAHAAGPRHRDGHVGLGDGVHGGGDQRNVEGDRAGEAADRRDLARMHRGVARHQQDVVEGEARLGANDGHALRSCRRVLTGYTTARPSPDGAPGGPKVS